MSKVKCTNLRFNLEKEIQRRAWECLQTMDKKRFKSYSHAVAVALVDYFERQKRLQDDPYLETREREERFVEQIVGAVENAMTKSLPVYLAGCMAGLSRATPAVTAPVAVPQANISAEDIDWDFLGG